MPQEIPATRAIAGLLLKTNIQYHASDIRDDVLDYVKALALRHVGDPDADVRNTLGTVITTILSRNSIMSWPEVLPTLMGLLDSHDPNVVEVGLAFPPRVPTLIHRMMCTFDMFPSNTEDYFHRFDDL